MNKSDLMLAILDMESAIVTIKRATFGGYRGDAWHLAVATFQKSVSAKESQDSNSVTLGTQ
jgi:hypothetical protein